MLLVFKHKLSWLSLLILENKTEQLVCNVKENSGILTLNRVYSYISVSSIKIFLIKGNICSKLVLLANCYKKSSEGRLEGVAWDT